MLTQTHWVQTAGWRGHLPTRLEHRPSLLILSCDARLSKILRHIIKWLIASCLQCTLPISADFTVFVPFYMYPAAQPGCMNVSPDSTAWKVLHTAWLEVKQTCKTCHARRAEPGNGVQITCCCSPTDCFGCSVGCMVAPSHCSNMVFWVALRRECIMARCSPAVKESARIWTLLHFIVRIRLCTVRLFMCHPSIACCNASHDGMCCGLDFAKPHNMQDTECRG